MEKPLGKISKESDGGYKVVFERLLNHPAEKVWDAITNAGELKYWFTDIDMDFRKGGKITIHFRDKDKTVSYGEIVEIDRPHRFVWTWEGELAVWELKDVGGNKTQLTLTYSKLSADYAVNAPAGFHSLLERLEARLGGSEAVHAFGAEENDVEDIKTQVHYAASVYNDFPDIVKAKPVEVVKILDAPMDRVWKAITDKEQMKQWYFELDDFRPEKNFRFSFPGEGHQGSKYLHLCVVTDVVPGRKLQYSWAYKGYPGYSLVTFELFPMDDKTKLRLTHHGLETFPQDSPDFARTSFEGGWKEIVGNLLDAFLRGK